MKTVLQVKDNATDTVLYMAMELSHKKWKLGFSNGKRNRVRTIDARDWENLQEEIELAKHKLDCTTDCRVVSGYEAGRDGFWIHRALVAEGIDNRVLDSASIEVSRRKKQALPTIRVPTVAEEDDRRLNRERDRLLKERGAHSTRIKSLNASLIAANAGGCA